MRAVPVAIVLVCSVAAPCWAKGPHADAPSTPAPTTKAARHGIGLSLAARLGAGPVAEAETGRRDSLGIEADASWDGLPHGLRIVGAFRDRLQPQTYLSNNLDPSTGALQSLTVNEQSLDAWIGVDWDLASVLGGSGWHARIGLAPRFQHLDNSAFTVSTGTFRLSGAASWAPVEHLVLCGQVGFGYRLFGTAETLSALGLPRALWDGGAGVRIPFGDGPTWSLSLGWSFDSIVFDRTTRVRHLAVAGLSVSL